jgi:protein gp37
LIEGEFGVKYGEGRIIFIENCNDLFAEAVPGTFISRVLAHCRAYPKNQYVIQTKNPIRVIDFIDFMPGRVLIGTTIESNRHLAAMGQAPAPRSRVDAMVRISGSLSRQTFVTVEPILDFDAPILAHWIAEIQPEFVNIGADSKGHGLIEPSAATIREFLKALDGYGIPVREKHNLGRLLV